MWLIVRPRDLPGTTEWVNTARVKAISFSKTDLEHATIHFTDGAQLIVHGSQRDFDSAFQAHAVPHPKISPEAPRTKREDGY